MTATVDTTPETTTQATSDQQVTLTLAGLRIELETHAWTATTSADPHNWVPQAPSYGQCAVTALIVQDTLGGDLLRCTADGVSHYFNRLPDGTTVDLTRDQFPTSTRFTDAERRFRDYVLSHPETAVRYGLLKANLGR